MKNKTQNLNIYLPLSKIGYGFMPTKRVDKKKKSDAYFIAFSIIFIAIAAILLMRSYSPNLGPTTTAEQACPKMIDPASPLIYGKGRSGNLDNAMKSAREQCNTNLNNEHTSQDAEMKANKATCENAKCSFSSRVVYNQLCSINYCESTRYRGTNDRIVCKYPAYMITTNPDNTHSFPPSNPENCFIYKIPSSEDKLDEISYYCYAEGGYNQDDYKCSKLVASASPTPTASPSASPSPTASSSLVLT